jgi:aspartate-semialdehyde dehydrogenase
MVGEVMLKVLERKFLSDTDELILVASERSVGKEIDFNGKSHSVVGLAAVAMQPDIALFSAGGETSLSGLQSLLQLEQL